MTSPKLYYDPTSEPCRAVYWLCLEAGVPVRLEYIWLTRNEHVSERLLAVNPFHQVPALRHDAFCLSEATAIMHYLAECSGCVERWFGSTVQQRARIHQRLSWYHTNLRRSLTLDYFLPVLLMPAYLGWPKPQPQETDALLKVLKRDLGRLNDMLHQAPFIAGDAMSAADILFAAELSALDIDPRWPELLADYPALSGWLGSLQARPAYQKSHGAWQHIAPKIRQAGAQGKCTDPAWVASDCEAFIAAG